MASGKGKSPHFIRAWRKYRGYTLEQLAERIGMTHQNLSKIERFKVDPGLGLLERLAEELRCEPADLIVRDPSQADSIWSIWEDIAPAERPAAARALQGFRKTGTDG